MFYLKALKDLDVARNQLARRENDEYYFDIVTYHIEQSIEKSLKSLVTYKGADFSRTHNIGLLLREVKSAYADEVSDGGNLSQLIAELEDSATLYTSWEASSRYDDDFIETRRNIDKGLDHAQRLVDECSKRRDSNE